MIAATGAFSTNSIGAGYVWTDSSGGWSSTPAAVLSDPTGGILQGMAPAVGDGFVATDATNDATTWTDIFTPGPTGWSGELTPAATLPGVVLAAAGDVIVDEPAQADPRLAVYVEPADGWTDATAPVAHLQLPGPFESLRVSVSDTTIAASSGDPSGPIELFTEPTGGWSGSIRPTAEIPVSGAMAVSGNTLAVVGSPIPSPVGATTWKGWPLYLIHRVRGVWQFSSQAPPATLVPGSEVDLPGVALSGSSLTVSLSDPVSSPDGVHAGCPCDTSLFTFSGVTAQTSPSSFRRWSPAVTESTTDTLGLMADGALGVVDGVDGADLYEQTTARTARVTGAAFIDPTARHPALRLRLGSPPDGQPVRTVEITLPSGLDISARRANRGQAISATGAGHVTVFARAATVTLTFAQPTVDTTVTLGSRALAESRALRARLTRLVSHSGRQRLTLQIAARSTAGTSSRSALTFTLLHS